MWLHLLAWLGVAAVGVASVVAVGTAPVVRQLDLTNETSGLSHLSVERQGGRVYVGGVNLVLQLDGDLKVEEKVRTGPRLDSPKCHASGCSDDVRTVPTDNYNKILVIDEVGRTVISCGSVLQGACHKYKLGNISLPSVFIPRNIAANDATSSTYAFIGPEEYHPWGSSNVLYVGTTFTSLGEYRHSVPAISTRNLHNLDLAELSVSKQSLLRIDVKYRDHFLVRYVYGFSARRHSYFVTVQKKSHLPGHEGGYISRLARSCITDANYDSYTEVSLACGDYNLVQDVTLAEAGEELARAAGVDLGEKVLLAAFSPSIGHSSQPQQRSAICVYSLVDIEQKFNENVHMCFNGSMQYRNMQYISGTIMDGKCPKAGTTGNILSFCEVGLKISGTTPITARPPITYPSTAVTSVAMAVTGRHSVAFLGTSDGVIKKVLVTGLERATQYEEVSVDPGSKILPDLTLDKSGEYLYVLSQQKVSKLRVQTCDMYTNCSSCLQAGDPYCGWCSLEKKCTVRSACQQAARTSPRWLSFGAGQQCIDFEQVLPDRIPVDQSVTVELTIRTLPELPAGARYLCVFGRAPPIEATVSGSGLSCVTPPLDQRPRIPIHTDHVMVPLSVRSSETNKDFVSRNFAYYDCSRHDTCGRCVRSQWACSWCVYDNQCRHNTSSCQRTVVSGINNPAQLVSHGPLFCPRFRTPSEPILLPNGVRKEIVMEAANLPRPQVGHTGFQCIVDIEGAKMMVPARVDSNRFIVCEKTTYSYEANTGEYEASVTVVWNRNHHVDTLNVTLYKCETLGSHRDHADCSLCVTREPKYRCSWCGSQCAYSETCRHTPVFECPKPRIDLITPLSGPVEGGTLVTIEGSNLGLKEADVRGRVTIGGIPCVVQEYFVSVKIVCRTGTSSREMDAAVVVGNTAGFTESSVKYSYKNMELYGVFPLRGPQSGGTHLVLTGLNLNMGSEVKAFLDHLPCEVSRGLGQLTCITARSDGPRNVRRLTLQMDAANRTLVGNPYNYTLDPTILDMKPLRTFAAGGRLVTVHGTNLDSVQQPRMLLYYGGHTVNSSLCSVLSAAQMECPSPAVNRRALLAQRRARRSRSPRTFSDTTLRLDVGFLMDRVESVRNLKKHFQNLRSTVTVVEDPRFLQFPRLVKLYKGDTLVIEGENLNLASDESDVLVTIGTRPCNVTSLALTQLVCTPPQVQPSGTNEIGIDTDTNLPLVVVRVGQNLRFPIGYLRYEMMKPYAFPPEAIGGIAAGGVFLVLLSLIILLVYRRKSTQAEREYKRIQIQMDTLESNVRSECKQAFAELQTDITDLTADLESSGIPTLDHKTYVMKVFFPGVSEHPILNDPKVRINGPRTNYDTAMLQFEQLVNNKAFLLAFIETLESQKSFSIRDKVNVASLLMVILMTKMEYATDVLRSLLLRLIEKSVDTKHPQLMLRRTESVVEKLVTNWMALCLYSYLKDYAAPSLFLLFKAIKHQVEKGPVDTVTHDARYSLSEERLLREQIDHSPVTIHLMQEDPHYEKIPYQTYHQAVSVIQDELEEKVQCKVLDCDTISQVKSKILDSLYKNTPLSLRPSIHEVDLEWRHGRGGHLTLADEDLTTKTCGGWRRVNTLAHYGVKDSAVMSLVPRQNDSFNSNCTGRYSIPCSLSPIIQSNGDLESNHVNVYHLVKPLDDQQSQRHDRHKAIPEIFLTRLLSTKGTVQKFVDDFFATVLSVNEYLPPAVKWLFDLLDEAAIAHNLSDPETVHAWKSNSLPLRFWVNFIKNPDFIFDVNKSTTVDSCLSVIAQTFMDACSTSEHRLGKDSPSNKLLFAKDIPTYKATVCRFYCDIENVPQVSDQEMNSHMHRLSMAHLGEFDVISALKELYIYVTKYNDQILESLDIDPQCRKLHLAHKLENVACTLDGEETSTC